MLGERERQQQVAMYLGYPFADLDRVIHDEGARGLLDAETMREHRVVPLKKGEDHLYLAMVDPCDFVAIAEVEARTRLRVRPVVCVADAIEQCIWKATKR